MLYTVFGITCKKIPLYTLKSPSKDPSMLGLMLEKQSKNLKNPSTAPSMLGLTLEKQPKNLKNSSNTPSTLGLMLGVLDINLS